MFVLNMRTRFPFRYGIASLEALPHLFLQMEVTIDGKPQRGIASEGLAPKWFTKNPSEPFSHELDAMLGVIRAAIGFAEQAPAAASFFDFWLNLNTAHEQWAKEEGYPPLLSSFGASLVERAVLEACCRAAGCSFAEAVRSNSLGIDLGRLHPELAGLSPGELLPTEPRRTIYARHTVGLQDPLTEKDISGEDRCHDGLPQSLEAAIKAYELRYFKVKLCGDIERDLQRLRVVAETIGNATPEFAFTLDGNEQYHDIGQFRDAWERIGREPSLTGFMQKLVFVEQPIHRDHALSAECTSALLGWADRPAMIIDESDGQLDSARYAIGHGYAGASHKNCKGVVKGVANACLIQQKRRTTPEQPFILSGEDLVNVGPIALLQDLAVVASLGIEHVERNGHHYFAGLSAFSAEDQQHIMTHHTDLYTWRDAPDGQTRFPGLNIKQGTISLDSVVEAPFGVGFEVATRNYTPLDQWSFDSLSEV